MRKPFLACSKTDRGAASAATISLGTRIWLQDGPGGSRYRPSSGLTETDATASRATGRSHRVSLPSRATPSERAGFKEHPSVRSVPITQNLSVPGRTRLVQPPAISVSILINITRNN